MAEIDWWVKGKTVLPFIRNGSKSLEVRPNWGKASRVRVGDILLINDEVRRRIVAIRHYPNIALLLEREDFHQIWPPAQSRVEVFQLWRSLYTEQDERKGVLVFQLEQVD